MITWSLRPCGTSDELTAVSLAAICQLWIGDPCFMLLIVLRPQPLYRLPVAAELLPSVLVRTSSFSESLKFLRFGTWAALPAADMPLQKMGRLLTGASKLG